MFNFNDHLQELRSTIVGLVLLLAATIIGFVWISIGLYHWLSLCLGAVWGPIVLGLLYFLPLVIFAFVKAFFRQPAVTQPLNDPANTAVLNISRVFERLSGRSPFFVATAVIIAGFLATRFPSLLAVFTQILTAYADDVKSREANSPSQPDNQSNTHSDIHQ
jgi:hypothetical protein